MRFAFCIEQNVSRLDVTMENAVLMRVMNSARYPGDEFRRLPNRHRRPPNDFVKLTAFDEFHAEIARAITLAHFVNRNDAGMLQTRRSFGFEAKAPKVHFTRPLTKPDDL